MEKLLIVDGHNLLFQMFFGMPSRIINKDGKAIQGTLGFVGALIKIIKMTEPTHIIVLFDAEQENDRAQLDAQYKANRADYSAIPDEQNPFSQLPDIYEALDFLAIKHTEVVGAEADDAISSYVSAYSGQMNIVISSFDSDFFQLINENTSILRYRGIKTILCDSRYVLDRYGVLPTQYPDFKSLTGDTSDNIRGAEKIGPKTAAQLIGQFGSLTQIIENAESISKPSIRASVLQNAERLALNYQLIKLDTHAAMPFELAQSRYKYSGISTTEVLKGIGLQ